LVDLIVWILRLPPVEQTRAVAPEPAEDDGSVHYFDDSINVVVDDEGSLEASGRNGIGSENVRQGLVFAKMRGSGVVLCVTPLAAGFLLGPRGAAIHQIEALTETRVSSIYRSQDRQVVRPTRLIFVNGPLNHVQKAVDIICHAIQLYKCLTEGNHRNVMVKRLHKLDGVLFRYEPPPRVPLAPQIVSEVADARAMYSWLRARGRGVRSEHTIREVRGLLVARDEAIMRENIPVRAGATARTGARARAPRSSNLYKGSSWDRISFENHGYARDRQEAGEGSRDAATMATITSSLDGGFITLDLRPHRHVVGLPASEHGWIGGSREDEAAEGRPTSQSENDLYGSD